MSLDVLIRGGTIVTPQGAFEGEIGIRGEKIDTVYSSSPNPPKADTVVDASGCYVTPGFIDAHTHMALPVAGTVSSDDFFTGGRAGAYGGVTTIIDFTTPNNGESISEAIENRQVEAKISPIDFSFHGTFYGYPEGGKAEFERGKELGVTSFKFFTAYGESDRRTDDGELMGAFRDLSGLNCLAMVHCENDDIIARLREQYNKEGRNSITYHPRSRPDYSEAEAIRRVIYLNRQAGGRVHIAHVSTKKGLEEIQEAKHKGARVSAETCPQYLLLTEKTFEGKDGHLFALTPPLRKGEDNRALWKGVLDGSIDLIDTDHCPFTRDQKDRHRDNFRKVPQGLPGVETTSGLLFDRGVSKRSMSLTRFVKLLSSHPAKTFGMYPKKGSLQVGTDADIAIFDPSIMEKIDASKLHMNTDFNPYKGLSVQGWVRDTFLRGTRIVKEKEFIGEKGQGEWVSRGEPKK